MNWLLFGVTEVVLVTVLVVMVTRRSAARGTRPIALWYLVPIAVVGIFLIFASWLLNNRQ